MWPFDRIRRAFVRRDYLNVTQDDHFGTGLSRDEMEVALRAFERSKTPGPYLKAPTSLDTTTDEHWSLFRTDCLGVEGLQHFRGPDS